MHWVLLCSIRAALQKARVVVSSSEMSVRSSITFTSIHKKRLFSQNWTRHGQLCDYIIPLFRCRPPGLHKPIHE